MSSRTGTRTNHRPKRDERKAQELTELKRENSHLRRALSQLRKEIERLDCLSPEEEQKPAEPPKQAFLCPVCKSANLFEMTTPRGKLLRSCRDCNWKN